MIAGQEFKNKGNKKNKSIFRFLALCILTLLGFVANGAEKDKSTSTSPATSVPTPSGTNSTNGSVILKKRNSDALLNDSSILNNYGITQSTDFSKTGFLRQDGINLPSGFANKISLTTSVEYDSNPALASNSKDSVLIYSLIPELRLNYVDEFIKYYLESALVFQRLSNNTILPDREDPNLTLGFDKTYASGTYGLSGNYSQFLSRGQQLRVSGEFLTEDSGESTQRTRSFAGYWIHNLTQRLVFSTNALYGKDAFSGAVGLTGSSLIDLRTKLNYEYSDRLDTYIQLGFSELRPDRPLRDVELSRVLVGANYLLSEKLIGAFRASQYHLTGGQSDTDWEAGALFRYDDDRMGYSLELNRELTPAGGVGGFQKADTYRLGWIFNISESDNLSTVFSLIKNKAGEGGFTAQDFREFNAGYNRTLWKNWNGVARLSYREVSSSGSSDAEGVLLGVSLTYGGLSF